jgi:hypothetical protein
MKHKKNAQIFKIDRKWSGGTIYIQDYFIAPKSIDAVNMLDEKEMENIRSIESIHSLESTNKISYFYAHQDACLNTNSKSNLYEACMNDNVYFYILADNIKQALACIPKSMLTNLYSTKNLTTNKGGSDIYISDKCIERAKIT